ncbi:MAG: hypothetical protein HFG38_08780 [Eubacterium sp.]|nr:hypothetical protein [Eubacterium sp.]
MVTKRWRKMVALLTAVTVITASVINVTSYVAAAPADSAGQTDTADGAGAETASGSTDTADKKEDNKDEEKQNIGEDGQVVMDGAVGKIDPSKWITIKDYELMAESDTYKLYFYEPRFSIILENKTTGKIIESTLSDEQDDGDSNAGWNARMKSGLDIAVIKGIQNTLQANMNSTENTVQTTKIDNGFSSKIYFTPYKFGFTVNVTIEGSDLVVTIPDDSIIEEQEGTYISSISVFPFMGYSFLDKQEGYMLIPDGNGALIDLDNKEGRYVTGFSQMIYGSDSGFVESDTKTYLWEELDMLQDASQVIAPVFGMAHTKDQKGYLAIVEKGEKRAYIEAQPNGAMVNYNRCFARFLIRDLFVQPLNNSNTGTVPRAEEDRTHSDLQVRYMLLSGDEVNYSTMAAKYREYLLNNGSLVKKDSSYNSRVDFLGTERENFLLGTRAVTMTTTDDIKNIFGELKSSGVESLLSVYKGWQDGGLYDLPMSKYNADGHIGGDSDLKDLIKDSESSNYKMYLYNDALRLNPSTNTFNFNTIKKVNKRAFEERVWADVYKKFNYLTPESSVEDFTSFVESMNNKELNRVALAGISNTLFSYSYKSSYYTRNNTADAYTKAVSDLDDKADMAMEAPNAYMWKNADAFLDMPLGSSDYMYVDHEIPFLSMVLKGVMPMYSEYINFEANKQEFFLQMVEAGVYPSFYLTAENSSKLIRTNSADLYSTEYTTYKDAVIDYDKKLRELNAQLGDANIVKHETRGDGIKAVTYSNGVKVFVNYTNTQQIVDGVTVEAMSYSYKAGEAE